MQEALENQGLQLVYVFNQIGLANLCTLPWNICHSLPAVVSYTCNPNTSMKQQDCKFECRLGFVANSRLACAIWTGVVYTPKILAFGGWGKMVAVSSRPDRTKEHDSISLKKIKMVKLKNIKSIILNIWSFSNLKYLWYTMILLVVHKY